MITSPKNLNIKEFELSRLSCYHDETGLFCDKKTDHGKQTFESDRPVLLRRTEN